MNIMSRLFLLIGASSAGLSVALGAVGAHRLQADNPLFRQWFETAVQYQQLHAVGLLCTGMLLQRLPASGWIRLAGVLMVLGTLLFSGNLYLRTLLDFHVFHAVTPAGGMALISAWCCLAIGVWKDDGIRP